jgi:DNA-binding XRE family transcriptional regulator
MQQYMMNKKEFSKFLNIAEQQYCRYENMTSQPSLEVALRISNALKITVNEIWVLKVNELNNII